MNLRKTFNESRKRAEGRPAPRNTRGLVTSLLKMGLQEWSNRAAAERQQDTQIAREDRAEGRQIAAEERQQGSEGYRLKLENARLDNRLRTAQVNDEENPRTFEYGGVTHRFDEAPADLYNARFGPQPEPVPTTYVEGYGNLPSEHAYQYRDKPGAGGAPLTLEDQARNEQALRDSYPGATDEQIAVLAGTSEGEQGVLEALRRSAEGGGGKGRSDLGDALWKKAADELSNPQSSWPEGTTATDIFYTRGYDKVLDHQHPAQSGEPGFRGPPAPTRTNSPHEAPARQPVTPRTEQRSSSGLAPPGTSGQPAQGGAQIPPEQYEEAVRVLKQMAPEDRKVQLHKLRTKYDTRELEAALGG